MGAQLISEVYRTGEGDGTFRSAYTLTYFADAVQVQALSGTYTRACLRELVSHFKSKPWVTHYTYVRRNRGRERVVVVPLY